MAAEETSENLLFDYDVEHFFRDVLPVTAENETGEDDSTRERFGCGIHTSEVRAELLSSLETFLKEVYEAARSCTKKLRGTAFRKGVYHHIKEILGVDKFPTWVFEQLGDNVTFSVLVDGRRGPESVTRSLISDDGPSEGVGGCDFPFTPEDISRVCLAHLPEEKRRLFDPVKMCKNVMWRGRTSHSFVYNFLVFYKYSLREYVTEILDQILLDLETPKQLSYLRFETLNFVARALWHLPTEALSDDDRVYRGKREFDDLVVSEVYREEDQPTIFSLCFRNHFFEILEELGCGNEEDILGMHFASQTKFFLRKNGEDVVLTDPTDTSPVTYRELLVKIFEAIPNRNARLFPRIRTSIFYPEDIGKPYSMVVLSISESTFMGVYGPVREIGEWEPEDGLSLPE